VEVEGRQYGASPNKRGPIGGGDGDTSYPPRPNHAVDHLDDLLRSLSKARSGDVIFVSRSVTIESTERVYIEKMVLHLQKGVILSSDRGRNGSHGALQRSDVLETRPPERSGGKHPDHRL